MMLFVSWYFLWWNWFV